MSATVKASLFASVLAWSIAARCGVPIWTQWDAGDRVDIAVVTGLAVYWVLRANAGRMP